MKYKTIVVCLKTTPTTVNRQDDKNITTQAKHFNDCIAMIHFNDCTSMIEPINAFEKIILKYSVRIHLRIFLPLQHTKLFYCVNDLVLF
jgi:hypothetical protein